jgi:hypothetical protein
MAVVNAKQVLSNLYGLMMEINLHREDEDVLAELQAHPDGQIDKHLFKIKQLSAKFKAETNRLRFQEAMEQITILKQKGLDELKKLLRPHEQEQLMPLFRKFEELTQEDQAAILGDQEVLQLMEILKNRLDENAGQ